ncbi:A24 family peptidase [Paenibacillus sp.]|uniref:A24 family peptidase n=1 Tax=Paenibacillus sp. TaxID=58172 RepID=UPI002D6C3BAE|nr:prepilin peptidase [Paenibacillus sp.]HZG58583.1 prepilin peptidase [Paenibacillus sp.]
MEWNWTDFVLIGVLLVCAATDAARRKIYNVVVFPALALAVAGHLATGGWAAAGLSMLGLFAGLSLLLIPYLMGGMGAGDVKLLAVVGALKGAAFAADAAIYMALTGFLLSVVFLLPRPAFRRFLLYAAYTVISWRPGSNLRVPRHGGALHATMPYGIAIACGALAALFWRGVVQG